MENSKSQKSYTCCILYNWCHGDDKRLQKSFPWSYLNPICYFIEIILITFSLSVIVEIILIERDPKTTICFC